jgi:hypothetical protein
MISALAAVVEAVFLQLLRLPLQVLPLRVPLLLLLLLRPRMLLRLLLIRSTQHILNLQGTYLFNGDGMGCLSPALLNDVGMTTVFTLRLISNGSISGLPTLWQRKIHSCILYCTAIGKGKETRPSMHH